MPLDLKTALAERRKSAEQALRISVCLDRDIVDEFEALQAERAEIVAPFEMRRQHVASGSDWRMGDNPATMSGVIDAEQAAATAEIDAKIADVQARGSDSTVQIVFAVLTPTAYQGLVNTHLTGDTANVNAFQEALLEACYRGIQERTGERPDATVTWAEVSEALNFGEVDAIAQQVLMANRGTVAAPFSRKSSATSH
jgi:hypothetical protein